MTLLAWLLLWNGLFMGTVMGVVQVTVQTASGPRSLGEAAASVQFSRSIGAAFGTAIVGAVLFMMLGLRNPEAARVFTAMTQHSATLTPLPAVSPAIRSDIAESFRVAFFTVAGFTAAGFFLALAIPMRRI